MINAVTEGVAFDFLMDRKGTFLFVVVKFHLRGVVTGFAVDKITNCSVLNDHSRPKGITRETEKVSAIIRGYFNYDVSPAGKNMLSLKNFLIWESVGNNFI